MAGEDVEKWCVGKTLGVYVRISCITREIGGCAVVRFFVGIRDMRRFVQDRLGRVSGSVVLLIYRTADGLVV